MGITAQYVSISGSELEQLLEGKEEFDPILDELDIMACVGVSTDPVEISCRRYAQADYLNRENVADKAGMSEAEMLTEIRARGIHIWLDLDKTWNEMHILLTGKGVPLELANSSLPDNDLLSMAVMAEENLNDDDVGYGPPRYVQPANVEKIAASLDKLNFEDLNSKHEAANESDSDWMKESFDDFKLFYSRAAATKNAVVLIYT